MSRADATVSATTVHGTPEAPRLVEGWLSVLVVDRFAAFVLVAGVCGEAPVRWRRVGGFGGLAGIVEGWLGVLVVDRFAATFDLLADAVEEHFDTALSRTSAGM